MCYQQKKINRIVFFIFCLFFYNLKPQNPFIQNKGQFPEHVTCKVNLPSGLVFLEKGVFTYAFYDGEQLKKRHNEQSKEKIPAHSYRVRFLNSNKKSNVILEEESKYFENYFVGNSNNWATNVKSYKRYIEEDIYNGIDLLLHVHKNKLKYEFHVKPKYNTEKITLRYEGVRNLAIRNGNLVYLTSVNKIIEHKPFAYQIIKGEIVEIPCEYKLNKNQLSYFFPEGYNNEYNLVIDPVLEFSSYSGSIADNFGYTATYDNSGYLYSGSTVFSIGYPTTIGAYDVSYNNTAGGTDIAITKYDTTGKHQIYSTYLGGEKDELPHSMIVNIANELFVFGTTGSEDFPTTNLAYQKEFQGGPSFSPSGIGVSFPSGTDIFVSKISANGGSLLASTFLGGSDNDGLNISNTLKYNYADEVRGEIDIDKNNNIYIATSTQSTNFPITNSFQHNSCGGQEGIIIKMDNELNSVIWSSYLGGSNDDAIYSLALDNENNIYVTGGTVSADFPTTLNAYLNTFQDSINADAFITQISSDGSTIINSSYYGTNKYDQSYFVEISKNNNIYLFGQTEKTGTSLVKNASYFQPDGGQFIAVLSKTLSSVLRATVLGTGKGTPDISPTAFLVDVCNKIYLSGWGSNLGGSLSTMNLPITHTQAYQNTTDGNDFYLLVIDDLMSQMLYGTYFGGSQSNEHVDGGTSRFDKRGVIYQSVCAGCGGNSDFPIEPNPGAVSAINNSSNCNNGVFKFNFNFPMVIADFQAPWVGCNTNITFQNLTSFTSSPNYYWDFGDGTISFLPNPTHDFTEPGEYTVKLIVTDFSSCNISDTISKTIYILSNSLDTLETQVKCINQKIQIGLLPVNDPTINYFWHPFTNLSSQNASNPICNTNNNTQYVLFVSNGTCTDTLIQEVRVIDFEIDVGSDTSYCKDPIKLEAEYNPSTLSSVWSDNISFLDTLSLSSELTIFNTGTYYIKVNDGNCAQIDSIEVVSENINISMFANDTCEGGSVFVGVQNLHPTIPINHYNWKGFLTDTTSIYDYPKESQWYVVEVINSEGCILKDSIFVNVYEAPILNNITITDSVVFLGESVIVFAETNSSINWVGFEETGNQIQDFPSTNFCYQVEVYNQHNCFVSDSICVSVVDVFCDEKNIIIPTAFTPNMDNKNDTYFILDKNNVVKNFKIEIFNRLGQKVFYSEDIKTTWDGSFRGKKLNPQVFDFYLELTCFGEKKLFKKGNITLIR